jgi:hypothetical protein
MMSRWYYGHELGHVVDFRSKNMLQSARSAMGHLSSKYKDRMEYNTDMILYTTWLR